MPMAACPNNQELQRFLLGDVAGQLFELFEPDAVLLSPACASLDMFRNYAHRAQVFADTANLDGTGSSSGSEFAYSWQDENGIEVIPNDEGGFV